MSDSLRPTQTVGILGGGQLGRMLSVAASRLGLRTHIYAPEKNPVAAHVADGLTNASYEDESSLRRFAQAVDVVTLEFENIPVAALDVLTSVRDVFPDQRALAVSQDRLQEKDFIRGLGIETAPYGNVESLDDLEGALDRIGVPSILKTRRFGYDGKGQVRLHTADQAENGWGDLQRAPCVLEGFVEFEREVSVIAARSRNGEIACFPPGENVHRHGILHSTTVPAQLSGKQVDGALEIAHKILGALNYVGVMGIELFAQGDCLIVNEVAPRVHNSGHWTQNGCAIDQFEQHIRAIAGWPLGDGRRHSNVTMINLIGDDVESIDPSDPEVAVHLYGKSEVRAGRKMGHLNRILGPFPPQSLDP